MMGSQDLPIVSYNIKLLCVAMEEQNSIVVFKKKMFKRKNVLQWLQIYALQEYTQLFKFMPMQKLVLSYERSSRTHRLHEMQPP
jgi:hypothetical protein